MSDDLWGGGCEETGQSLPCGRGTHVIVIICAVEDKTAGCEETAAGSELRNGRSQSSREGNQRQKHPCPERV